MEQDINEFDVAVQTHERHGSKMPEDIKAAILVAGVQDKELQQWLMVNAEKLMDYEGVKKHVRTYLTNKRTFKDAAKPSASDAGAQEPVPMDLSVLRSQLHYSGYSKAEAKEVIAVMKGKGEGKKGKGKMSKGKSKACLLYTSPSPRDRTRSRMPSSA